MYCNRTATGLVQASTQRTYMFCKTAENPINKPKTGHARTGCNGRHRIVALEAVAGSSPVGHPMICVQLRNQVSHSAHSLLLDFHALP
jgi:hypothetical protein